ncbi:MAG: FAD-binding oxidoreductase [candidate division Zixibacteria bacterium]|nr:FAD-binding oxidoreductase [candidate division Zixibacteria bacterium]
MSKIADFLDTIRAEFPDDRLTFQKRLATFHPESADEAARLFKMAGAAGQQVYITGYGNNIDPDGESFADLLIVRTDRLNHVHEISETDLFVRVGSGYPMREINKELESHQLYTPHSALSYVGSTGGAVAVNLSAELNGHDLPIKKYFLQAEIVTPKGEIITPGSICFKSVSGYDIVKIYAASWGLLGLMVSITFRVMPLTAAEEYATMKMKAIDRRHFLSGLDESISETDAIYSRKIKAKFDPLSILPIV